MIRKVLRGVTALEIYSVMDRKDTVFLDSSGPAGGGRVSIIGAVPYRTIVFDGETIVDGVRERIGFTEAVDREIYGCDPDVGSGDPLIGYISYDFGLRMAGVESVHPGNGFPECALTRFDVIVTEDRASGEIEIVCRGRSKSAEEEMSMILDAVSKIGSGTIPAGVGISSMKVMDRDRYKESVRKAAEIMRDGGMYVVNLTHTIEAISGSDPFGVFMRLREISPSPYGAYMDIGGIQIISSSMELLIEIAGSRAVTRPIKGTAPRTGDPAADAESLDALMSSEKERSELLMVTDMERNDMNRFCVPGSVKVDGFFVPEEYSTVFHTVSEISGTVKEGVTVGDVIRCMFPGGSVTGAPKLSAMQHIDALEECGRGLYTGTLCVLSRGRSVMNIAIRTMVHSNGTYRMGVGSGITWESDPDSEYDETMHKAKAMLRSLE